MCCLGVCDNSTNNVLFYLLFLQNEEHIAYYKAKHQNTVKNKRACTHKHAHTHTCMHTHAHTYARTHTAFSHLVPTVSYLVVQVTVTSRPVSASGQRTAPAHSSGYRAVASPTPTTLLLCLITMAVLQVTYQAYVCWLGVRVGS